jgi:tetratricopeptide (TPR) repeat protein
MQAGGASLPHFSSHWQARFWIRSLTVVFWLQALSCHDARPVSVLPRESLASWDRVLASADEQLDFDEVTALLAPGRSEGEAGMSARDRLAPYIREVRSRSTNEDDDERKVALLNECVLPAIRRGESGEFRWLHDAFSSELGPCVVNALLYLIAADAVSSSLEIVLVPSHVYLRQRRQGAVRNIEVTRSGEHLTERYYQQWISEKPALTNAFPPDEKYLEKLVRTTSRREFTAVLILMNAQKADGIEKRRALDLARRLAPESMTTMLALGNSYRLERNFVEARKWYDRAALFYPCTPVVYRERALSLVLEGNPDQALIDYDRALELAPRCAPYHLERAVVLQKLDRPALTIEACSSALALMPDLAGARRLRAQGYGVQQEFRSALADYSYLDSHGQSEPTDSVFKGLFRLGLGDLDMAWVDFSRAIEAVPGNPLAWRGRGLYFRMKKQYPEAIKDFSKAIELEPSDPELYILRAKAYAAIGDDVRFNADYEKANQVRKK